MTDGPVRGLEKLGVLTQRQMLDYFPRAYIQESPERPIAELKTGEIQSARGIVCAIDFIPGQRSRFVATLFDGAHALWLVFFNSGYLRSRIVPGMSIRARGKVARYRGEAQMTNPKWQVIDPEAPRFDQSVYRPIYPATGALPSFRIEKLIGNELDTATKSIDEWFHAKLLKRRKLMPRPDAYRAIHQPRDARDAAEARRRLVYDEVILMQLALAIGRGQRQAELSAPRLKIDKLLDSRIRRRLGFTLTAAQDRVIWDIVRDFQRGEPMNRLLQGDVGSGKTAVAVYAMLAAAANGLQSALLAPTEVLAEQHYLNLTHMLADSRLKIGLFTLRSRKRDGESLRRNLTGGQINLAIGTQALLQQDITFANLGLVVVDEQHRLGVLQRAILHDKAQCPHYLVMTATPIPRTLAMSYFADFDASVIDELPPGRQPIATRRLDPTRASEAYGFVRDQVSRGRQAYIVLPAVGEADSTDATEAKSVLRELERLTRGPLAGLRLAPLHGRMTTEEKQSTMTAFRDRKIDVLLASTVIEVGIDVPNATVILIDQADRFGLSQLHQLRGRVGRGREPSHCILLSTTAGPDAEARLDAVAKTNSGFEIAEMDLRLRGPGEFFGSRQHGLPEFKLAELSKELHVLSQARDDARAILADDALLAKNENRSLRDAMVNKFGQSLGLGQVG